MTDKEKIREEVERLFKENRERSSREGATNRPLTECDDCIKYKNGDCIGDNSAAKGSGLCKKLNENGEYINPEKELRNSIEDFKEVCLYPIANYGNSIITRIIKKICKLTHHKSDYKIKKLEE